VHTEAFWVYWTLLTACNPHMYALVTFKGFVTTTEVSFKHTSHLLKTHCFKRHLFPLRQWSFSDGNNWLTLL